MAAIISDANVTSYIRSLVNEDTAKFWTDADITLYKQFGMMAVQSRFHPWLQETYKTFANFGITDGTAKYDPATDLSITNLHKVIRIEEQDQGETLRYIQDDEYWKYAEWADGDPVAWMWDDNDIRLIPTPNSTDSTFLRIWYTTHMTTVETFPECLRPLIAIEAVIYAKVKDEDLTADVYDLRRRFEMNAYMDLTFSQMQEPIIFRDGAEEDKYA